MPSATTLIVETPRTLIVTTPTDALEGNAALEEFEIDVVIDGAPQPVRVPPGWPGDDLEGLPDVLALRRSGQPEPWTGMVIDREALEAVGQIGCTRMPDAAGVVEVRYATVPERRNHGIATEAGGAFVDWLLQRPEVTAVVAECLVTNAASVRVLEKTGFELAEEREEPGGRLLRWVKRHG